MCLRSFLLLIPTRYWQFIAMENWMIKSKNRVPLYSLFTTSLISVTGDVMASLAIPWFVLQTTGSVTQTGITVFFGILPMVIAMAFGGTLVDRIGYKRISVLADLARGI